MRIDTMHDSLVAAAARRADAGAAPASLAQTFQEEGWVGPLTLCSPTTMARLRSHFDEGVLKDGRLAMRHLDVPAVYHLCCSEALLAPVSQILGPDLVVWRTRFIVKEPGGSEIPWHHDGAYFETILAPLVNVTAWIAIDDVDRENACVRLIPGSHRRRAPHQAAAPGVDPLFAQQADPADVDETSAVAMEMRAGQFFVFDEALLHSSPANHSLRRRAALSLRITIPSVKINGPLAAAVLVRGEDRHHVNPLVKPCFPVRGDT
jgi:ectoine hydroxylase-related dioxygenase (phytanoyl-CoA dioxygenase family)